HPHMTGGVLVTFPPTSRVPREGMRRILCPGAEWIPASAPFPGAAGVWQDLRAYRGNPGCRRRWSTARSRRAECRRPCPVEAPPLDLNLACLIASPSPSGYSFGRREFLLPLVVRNISRCRRIGGTHRKIRQSAGVQELRPAETGDNYSLRYRLRE